MEYLESGERGSRSLHSSTDSMAGDQRNLAERLPVVFRAFSRDAIVRFDAATPGLPRAPFRRLRRDEVANGTADDSAPDSPACGGIA
jgi:hypothetical protein